MKTPLNRFRLDGQVAIVTGGGNGIGRATAELLVEAGAAVALIDRDERAVENTKVALLAAGAQVEAYIVDVTDEAAIEARASEPYKAEFPSRPPGSFRSRIKYSATAEQGPILSDRAPGCELEGCESEAR
jgi:hypothetical protein